MRVFGVFLYRAACTSAAMRDVLLHARVTSGALRFTQWSCAIHHSTSQSYCHFSSANLQHLSFKLYQGSARQTLPI